MTNVVTGNRLEEIEKKLKEGSGIHIELDDTGLIHIERKLPFLIVYRPSSSADTDPVIESMVRNEASYMICRSEDFVEYRILLRKLVKNLSDNFGAFLILEIWSGNGDFPRAPNVAIFEISGPGESLSRTAGSLRDKMVEMDLAGLIPRVIFTENDTRCPEGLEPLLEKKELKQMECLLLGLRIEPFYRDPQSKRIYPLLARRLYLEFSLVFKKSVFDFIKVQKSHNIAGFQSLARRKAEEGIWEIDRQLVEIDSRIQFLLLISPVNSNQAWKEFRKNKFRKEPVFHYRMLPNDPELIKRELYNIRIEDIADPTLGFLFREKRAEVDKMLTMLSDRESVDFYYGSLQLFGAVSHKLLAQAGEIMETMPIEDHKYPEETEYFDAAGIAELAREEFSYLSEQWSGVNAGIEIKDTIDNLMVNKGILHIPAKTRIKKKRAEALIQHEVGTHILTYFNGMSQPLKLLSSGIPGFEELQEGIAVLAEYLAGGLSRSRMQVLAARVIAVDSLINQHDFVKTFELLTGKYHFKPKKAFFITTRVYRGGGLTKDAIYLRGLTGLIRYLKEGNPLEPLLIGKIRQNYIPVIRELVTRKILSPIQLKPRYLSDPKSLNRLAQIQQLDKITDLINTTI